MGMSTYVQAFRDMDGEFKRMMEIKKFCDERDVSYPVEVAQYFGSSISESEKYITEEMLQVKLPTSAIEEFRDDMREGIEINVANIPKEVKTIRFVNSY